MAVLLGIAHQVGFIAKTRRHPGKAMLGIRVVRLDTLQGPARVLR